MESKGISIPVEKEYLEGLLQKVLGCSPVALGEWEEHRLSGGLEYGTAIYRICGEAGCNSKTHPWSLILKSIHPGARDPDPQGFDYWKREALAYQSGFLIDLPGKLAAPDCYEVAERPDGSIWIWMEDVQDDHPGPWSIEQYAQVARHLGLFNGAYLAGRPLPAETWISHDWLPRYLEHAALMVDFVRQHPAHPIVQLMFPGLSLPMTLAAWDERSRMLKALDHLPHTFCHQDAFKRNLFLRGDEVIAVDWSFTGIAPVGAELAPLIGAAFGLAKFPSSQAMELDKACFSAYLQGLHQAGWQPDPRQVRRGYTLTVVLRYVLGATLGQELPGLLDEKTRQHWIEGMEGNPEKAGESDPGIVAYFQSIFIEALRSLGLASMLRFLGITLGYAIRLGRKRRSAP